MKLFSLFLLSLLTLSEQSKRQRALEDFYPVNRRNVVRRLDPRVDFLKACGEGNLGRVLQSPELLEELGERCVMRALLGNQLMFCKHLITTHNITITEGMLSTAVNSASPRMIDMLVDRELIESGQLDPSLVSNNINLLKTTLLSAHREKFFVLLPFYEPSEELADVLMDSARLRFPAATFAVLRMFAGGPESDELTLTCIREAFGSRHDSTTGLLLLDTVKARPELTFASPNIGNALVKLESYRHTLIPDTQPSDLLMLKSALLVGNFKLLETAMASTALFTTHFTQLIEMAMEIGSLPQLLAIVGKSVPAITFSNTIVTSLLRRENWTGLHTFFRAFDASHRQNLIDELIKGTAKKATANRLRALQVMFVDLSTTKGINYLLVFMEMHPEQTLLISALWGLVFDFRRSDTALHLLKAALNRTD